MTDLSKTYNPQEVEDKTYQIWEKSGFFAPENLPKAGKPFTIIMPPPNVTGQLHVGHALMLTLQDIMIRYQRMRGRKTLWLPGTDHAAIATQARVEKELYKQEGKTRFDLGRDEFLRRVEEFAQASHNTIVKQIRRLGSSCDWSREAFTLDKTRSLAVKEAFKQMYKAGLIYRGERIINWDPKLKTTVSDDELEWREEKSPFYYLKYGPFIISTARPETKFGDKYVVMHPKDKRYRGYQHGQKLAVDWINGKVTATVIKDEAVDMAFGTGVMTITPWHDAADFEIARRHKLDMQQIIDFDSALLPVAGEFAGMKIAVVRPLIVEKLKKKGLLQKTDENYVHRKAYNSRGGGLIEPQVKEQWFIDVNAKFQITNSKLKGIKSGQKISLKELMRTAVKSGQIKIIPKRFEKIYFHWIENLRDWCISRQIWYGHRIPVWYRNEVKSQKSKVKSTRLKMGFHEAVVPQVFQGKSVTYRLRDHKFKAGDEILLENSQSGNIFGTGKITRVEPTTVDKINLKDKRHWATYKSVKELIRAFKKHYPERKVTPQSKVWIYEYEFDPLIHVGENTPKGEGWTQDPDTLDTWFSSGLWTFSTLGWPSSVKTSSFAPRATADRSEGRPKPGSDLDLYHPTDVLETGYDILFFWVARMILMTGFLLDDIPFHTVYLHGLVRDKDRQKMSKSKGNVIDPLGIIGLYGTDALRMALIVGNLPGADLPLSEDKVRGYRNFANKIWNAARFVMLNTSDFKGQAKLTAADKKLISNLNQVAKSITKKMDRFDFAHTAEDLYHFFWHTFADKIIEESKAKLAHPKTRASAQQMLLTYLEVQLKLLHPFIPFLTEHLWGILKKPKNKTDLLLVQPWPK